MTEKESKNSPRKRGAQTSNTNALKHGFYSKRLNTLTEKPSPGSIPAMSKKK